MKPPVSRSQFPARQTLPPHVVSYPPFVAVDVRRLWLRTPQSPVPNRKPAPDRDRRKNRKKTQTGEPHGRWLGSLPVLPAFCAFLSSLRQYPSRPSGALPRSASNTEAGIAARAPTCFPFAALRLRGFVDPVFPANKGTKTTLFAQRRREADRFRSASSWRLCVISKLATGHCALSRPASNLNLES